MSAETDWREAARGIPVWEGAAAWFEGKRWRVTRLWPSMDGHEDRASLECLDGSGDGEIPPIRHAVPDLADPDTRAAYDRRLALALGCPEAYADVGVRFRRLSSLSPSAGWIVEAGHDEHDFYDGPAWTSEPRTVAADAEDPLLARALAWPADKRVI